eukprot:4390316-Pleurochrysis_carterae.AAC.1
MTIPAPSDKTIPAPSDVPATSPVLAPPSSTCYLLCFPDTRSVSQCCFLLFRIASTLSRCLAAA